MRAVYATVPTRLNPGAPAGLERYTMQQPNTTLSINRRDLIKSIGAVTALTAGAVAAPPTEPYRLGVMAGMYGMLPVDEAMSRIRKAGYRYASMARKHGNEIVFAPELSKVERKTMLRRIRGLGIEPFLSLGGFAGDPETEAGLRKYIDQIDLCVDYEIPIIVGAGPWYYTRFPTVPKRERDWAEEVSRFYAGLEKAIRHAESVRVVIALKPHTGITARAKDCMEVMKRFRSPYFSIAWDAGNVSFYEGIYPDPDLAALAPNVKAVCIKDHLGLRGDANFPVPGQGQVDHDEMFRTLFSAGFNGPMAIERLDGRTEKRIPPEVVDERLKAARDYLVPLLDRITGQRKA
jgi:sugar phosphate isomerase/epimerase